MNVQKSELFLQDSSKEYAKIYEQFLMQLMNENPVLLDIEKFGEKLVDINQKLSHFMKENIEAPHIITIYHEFLKVKYKF